jgi:hypothetical protein
MCGRFASWSSRLSSLPEVIQNAHRNTRPAKGTGLQSCGRRAEKEDRNGIVGQIDFRSLLMFSRCRPRPSQPELCARRGLLTWPARRVPQPVRRTFGSGVTLAQPFGDNDPERLTIGGTVLPRPPRPSSSSYAQRSAASSVLRQAPIPCQGCRRRAGGGKGFAESRLGHDLPVVRIMSNSLYSAAARKAAANWARKGSGMVE